MGRRGRDAMKVARAALRALFGLGSLATFVAATGAARVSAIEAPSDVRTIAGSGEAGLADGPAAQASFLAPAGVALGRDGSLYIADSAAQRIRLLSRDGIVRTVAGEGAPDSVGLAVPGGYRDGSSGSARFNRPLGLAIGPDGALYVADELNHCIRRIVRGVVTTYAGAPVRPGNADGNLRSARFTHPRALAFDGSGDLFVADFGVGIRKISPDGLVSTIAIRHIASTFTGVSVFGSGASSVIFVANLQGMGVFQSAGNAFRFYTSAEGGALGFPYAVQALSKDEALFSDTRTHTIRYFRAARPPAVATALSLVLGGAAFEDTDRAAGDAEGRPAASRFDVPLGLALQRDGGIVVSDAGNRRIRRLPAIHPRALVFETTEFDRARRDLRIVFVSDAYASWNAPWERTVGGLLEERLKNDRSRLGLAAVPHVDVVRLDGASVRALRDYVELVLSRNVADLVVLGLNMPQVYVDIARDRSLQKNRRWVGYVAGQLRASGAALRRAKTGFVVLVQPSPFDASPLESLALRETTITQALTYEAFSQAIADLGDAARQSGERVVDLTPSVFDYERRRGDVPLFEGNGLLSVAGNAFVASAVARYLEQRRPW